MAAPRKSVADTRAAPDAAISPRLPEIAKLNWPPRAGGDVLQESLLEDPTRSSEDDAGTGTPAGMTGNR